MEYRANKFLLQILRAEFCTLFIDQNKSGNFLLKHNIFLTQDGL